MSRSWRTQLSLLLLGLLAAPAAAEHSFENTAVVRTVELGGSLVHVTTTYAVRALDDGSSIYTIALGEDEQARTAYIQAKMKGQSTPLQLEHFGLNPITYVVCCASRTGTYLWLRLMHQRGLSVRRGVPKHAQGERVREPCA